MENMEQYLTLFVDESKDNLQAMNSVLLKLEDDYSNTEYINDIFRVAHTIKGMAGTMGFTSVTNVTHEMENVLDHVRNGKLSITAETINILFECFDVLESFVSNIEQSGSEGDADVSDLISKLSDLLSSGNSKSGKSKSKKASAKRSSAKVEEGVVDLQQGARLTITLASGCLLKSARAFIIINEISELVDILGYEPSQEAVLEGDFDNEFSLLVRGSCTVKALEQGAMNISEVEGVSVTHHVITEEEDEAPVASTKEIATQMKKTLTKAESKADVVETAKQPTKQPKTVRVDIDRLDNLMNLVSELIIIKTRLDDKESTDLSNIHDSIEYLERITTSLHDAVMKVRMVPVERTFNRFPRLVRDLAKDLGKNIKLVMSGEETEVDRTVIDEIGDPLIHLIRNSIDHGIESPEYRAANGKPDFGTINLRAYPDGNTVVIEVEDDGAGVNTSKVLQKALEKGLITHDESETMTQQEIIGLLFRSGFSTADEITDISGRGVGLDVVKMKIEALNGSIEVKSTSGVGSRFIIRLPLTLAIIQALMVRVDEEQYAIPLSSIKEITTVNKEDISLIKHKRRTLYRGNSLPLISLSEVLSIAPLSEEAESYITVIMRKGDVEYGVIVDTLVGQQEIVIKSLGKYMAGVKLIAGATILGNGNVALIIDPNQLI